jgi:hypothetical protein
MKTLRFFTWQEGLDLALVFLWLSISITSGFVLPSQQLYDALLPRHQPYLPPLTSLIVAASGAAIWCMIRLFEPKQYGNKWTVARFVILLTTWISIITAIYFLYGYLTLTPQEPQIDLHVVL